MQCTESEWKGFRRLDFSFRDHDAILICPHQAREDGKWLLKTEYFGAFPEFELRMLALGYHLAHVRNTCRYGRTDDIDRQAAFCTFLHEEFGLAPTCLPVGMSCGGMQAVYLATGYPHLVSALYLDAPVLNFLSWPCFVGRGGGGVPYEEFVRFTGKTLSDLINDRDHPIDRVGQLIGNRVPLALVCGAADTVVPYAENGELLARKYRTSGVPFFEVTKPGCGHHPHGLEDPEPLIAFLREWY